MTHLSHTTSPWKSCLSPVLSPLCHGALRKLSLNNQRDTTHAPGQLDAQNLYFYPFFPPSPAGQKATCGLGLEGPWERPPPLDEPQRDGSSEDQVENPAQSGEAWSVGWGR